ncbi:Dihydroxy-acid dehydratase (EC [Olavius algarvensis Delta 1 endosymbiont]|nr:Dihydroxy-acid dehydratase (EC [Olavius algarvensis Delta 1 endosymbiont]
MASKKRDSRLPEYAQVEREQMLRGIGYGDEALERPQIGVVSSWGEINPASIHLDRVSEAVKAGVWSAGGTPREFVISSICTSMAGDDRFHLPHRDLVAGYIETVAETNLFDGLVCVPICDDVIPAHLMAAARLNLPSVFVTGGYMQLNRHQGEDLEPLDVAPVHFAEFKAGKISPSEFNCIKERGCMGTGACPIMGTANTMAAMAEALGMTFPGNTTVPGADSQLMRYAFRAGQQVVHLQRSDMRPADIMTPAAFRNAIRLLMAVGGSTNAVLHLQAVAAEMDLEIEPRIFNELSRTTPFICDVIPSGPGGNHLGTLDEAGGIQAVMKELEPLLDTEALTVTGASLADNLKPVADGDRYVIRSLNDPLDREGGLIFLQGNLAPGGGLIKKSAVPAEMIQHRGPARIFATEEQACEALNENKIAAGEVVIVRYVGPKGDPGMRLLQRFLWQVAAKGMEDKIAFVTDGRFSGTNKGCAVAHVAPEAMDGGPLAVVRDGDIIEIDIPNQTLRVDISDEALQSRMDGWTPPERSVKKGWLSIYAKTAKAADQGAALRYE